MTFKLLWQTGRIKDLRPLSGPVREMAGRRRRASGERTENGKMLGTKGPGVKGRRRPIPGGDEDELCRRWQAGLSRGYGITLLLANKKLSSNKKLHKITDIIFRVCYVKGGVEKCHTRRETGPETYGSFCPREIAGLPGMG